MYNKVARDRVNSPINAYRARFPGTHNTEHFTEVHYDRFNPTR